MLEARFLLKPSESDGLLPPLPPLCFSIAFHTETASLSKEERKEIADKLKTKYKTINKKFKNRTETILWIINNQLGRRNISKWDRTRLALKKEDILKPIAEKKYKETVGRPSKLMQKSATISPKIDVRKQVAKIAKVSHDTVTKVKYIEKLLH